MDGQLSGNVAKESGTKKGSHSRAKQSLRAIYEATRIGRYQSQKHEENSDLKIAGADDSDEVEMKSMLKQKHERACLLWEIFRTFLNLHCFFQRKQGAFFMILFQRLSKGGNGYCCTVHGGMGYHFQPCIEEACFWPGPCLLAVGDRKGAVFGGLVEAPLRPANKKYQGSNSTFVFTNTPGYPVIFHPTGANRYFTLCSTAFLAIGGGGHFALYLHSDLLNGSSSVSETYGNPCLAHSEAFEVKEVELWGFVHGSQYEEILDLSRTEAPGICRF
ncbi:hypothetical protein OIU84_006410 [Salix udensis]|uniref:Oxidation resistance protein 1 n=1 Tax=Salix udensis TaxID=889485 RepID=A0AAD6P276_9ROSI|nr:hypothetical protein OIU84_006410 [Salix udensis]